MTVIVTAGEVRLVTVTVEEVQTDDGGCDDRGGSTGDGNGDNSDDGRGGSNGDGWGDSNGDSDVYSGSSLS